MLPLYYSKAMPLYYTTMLSLYHATMLLLYYTIILSCYHFAMLLCYYVITLLCYHVATLLCYYDKSQKSKKVKLAGPLLLQNYLNITKVFHIWFCRECPVACGRKKVAQKVKEKCYGCVNLACWERFRSGFLNLELTFLLCCLCTFFASPRRAIFKRYNQPAGYSNREKRPRRGKPHRVVTVW